MKINGYFARTKLFYNCEDLDEMDYLTEIDPAGYFPSDMDCLNDGFVRGWGKRLADASEYVTQYDSRENAEKALDRFWESTSEPF